MFNRFEVVYITRFLYCCVKRRQLSVFFSIVLPFKFVVFSHPHSPLLFFSLSFSPWKIQNPTPMTATTHTTQHNNTTPPTFSPLTTLHRWIRRVLPRMMWWFPAHPRQTIVWIPAIVILSWFRSALALRFLNGIARKQQFTPHPPMMLRLCHYQQAPQTYQR